MPQGVEFQWHGDKITRQVVKATIDAIDDLTQEGVDAAYHRAPVKSGNLRRNIDVQPAKHDRSTGEIHGAFGVKASVRYAPPVEAKHGFVARAGEEISGAKLAERIRARMRRPRVV